MFLCHSEWVHSHMTVSLNFLQTPFTNNASPSAESGDSKLGYFRSGDRDIDICLDASLLFGLFELLNKHLLGGLRGCNTFAEYTDGCSLDTFFVISGLHDNDINEVGPSHPGESLCRELGELFCMKKLNFVERRRIVVLIVENRCRGGAPQHSFLRRRESS